MSISRIAVCMGAALLTLSGCGTPKETSTKRNASPYGSVTRRDPAGARDAGYDRRTRIAGLSLGMPVGAALALLTRDGWTVRAEGGAKGGASANLVGRVDPGAPSYAASRGGEALEISISRFGARRVSGISLRQPADAMPPVLPSASAATRTRDATTWRADGAKAPCSPEAGEACLTLVPAPGGGRTVTINDGGALDAQVPSRARPQRQAR